MIFRARLVGGPFDGDQGHVLRLPASIWAYVCLDPACQTGNIHWSPDSDVEDAVRYDLDTAAGRDAAGFHSYVYPELTRTGHVFEVEALA